VIEKQLLLNHLWVEGKVYIFGLGLQTFCFFIEWIIISSLLAIFPERFKMI